MFRKKQLSRVALMVIAGPVCVAIAQQPGATSGGPGRGGAARPPDTKLIVFGNDKIELTLSQTGSKFTRLILRDGDPLSPIASIGHFLALDGFGDPSPEEAAVGMPYHGEANRRLFDVIATHEPGPVHLVSLRGTLPLAQETVTRTVEIVDGENIVYVTTEVESGLNIDRPMTWAEHATVGPPYMEKGKMVVDMSAINCRVRPYMTGAIPGHLVYDKDFRWPLAPANDGKQVDIREIPTDHDWLDHASCEMDTSRRLEFVTALHLEKHLVYGYVFRRADYPWTMSWMNFSSDARAARGMEFSTQPWDVSHRDAVALNPLFGAPTFRWLPAKSKVGSKFLIFYTRVPANFTRIDDVRLEDGKLTILDHSGQTVVLPASREL